MYQAFIKPAFDFLVAFVGFIILLPVFLVVTLLLYMANQGKPFFFQQRPGKNGKIFKVIKYKTMNDAKSANGELLPDEKRLTSIGKFVRKTSLDELPQLLNVIVGNMSLIGPRPLLMEYMDLYNERQLKRHNVRPGITGWAQVNGRNSIGWVAKFEYDIWYVENLSFILDLRIFWLTILKVLNSEGVNATNEVPMEKFKGND
ncbi:MAG: sugar transferase [Sphingobacteriales bacterium]|nr:MAG: sugar transferase [Sphingobacteriales bacterium]